MKLLSSLSVSTLCFSFSSLSLLQLFGDQMSNLGRLRAEVKGQSASSIICLRTSDEPPLNRTNGGSFFLGSGTNPQKALADFSEVSIGYRKNSAFFSIKPCHLAGTFPWAKIADTGHAGTQASQSMHVAGSIYICS
jgi:hypothetical protein